MKLWIKILIGMILGVLVGLLFGSRALFLKPFGDIFLQLITMIIPFLVLSSMVAGITSIHDPKRMGRLGLFTLSLYVGTTLIAIVFGLFFVYLLEPGAGLNMKITEVGTQAVGPTLSEILLSMVPSNPVMSLAEGNVIQIIVFSVFSGFAINLAGEKGKPLLRVVESLAEVMYKFTQIIIDISPYGIFAIMAYVTGSFGFSVLLPLSKFLLAMYLSYFFHSLITFCSMIRFLAKVDPIPFFRGMTDSLLMAFSTASSSATLPITMSCVQDNLGVSKSVSGFMLPLGATINMNGAALYMAGAAVFVAQSYNIDLSATQLLSIVITSTLTAIGTAGIPGAGFVVLAAVCSSAGLPIEGIMLLAGIDRIREMGSTVVNVLGDATCTLVVAKKEGELDQEKYLKAEQSF